MVSEMVLAFWAAMARGEFVTAAAAEAGTYREKGTRWLIAENGIRPRRGRDLKGRCLTFSEREKIALGRARGESMRAIGARLGRNPSTISRRWPRNAGRAGWLYRATARARAGLSPRRSTQVRPKLATNLKLRQPGGGRSLAGATRPSRSSGACARHALTDPEMRVSAETIYQSLYVQSRGALRRDLTKCLRTGRALRTSQPPRGQPVPATSIPDLINISERPAKR